MVIPSDDEIAKLLKERNDKEAMLFLVMQSLIKLLPLLCRLPSKKSWNKSSSVSAFKVFRAIFLSFNGAISAIGIENIFSELHVLAKNNPKTNPDVYYAIAYFFEAKHAA